MRIIPGPWVSVLATAAVVGMAECQIGWHLSIGCLIEPGDNYVWDQWNMAFDNHHPKFCPVLITTHEQIAASGTFIDAGTIDFRQGDVKAWNSNHLEKQDLPIWFGLNDDGINVGQGYIYWTAGTGTDPCWDYVVYTPTLFANGVSTGNYPQEKVTLDYVYVSSIPDCDGFGGGDNMRSPSPATGDR